MAGNTSVKLTLLMATAFGLVIVTISGLASPGLRLALLKALEITSGTKPFNTALAGGSMLAAGEPLEPSPVKPPAGMEFT